MFRPPAVGHVGRQSSGAITTAQISTRATAYFNALFTDTSALPTITVTATYAASTSIQLTGDGNYTTSFMTIAGCCRTVSTPENRWPSYGNGNTRYSGQIDARQKDAVRQHQDPERHDLHGASQLSIGTPLSKLRVAR